MEIRLLTTKEIIETYNKYLVKDFPADEVKPLSRIMDMYNGGEYFAYGLYDTELVGYAYFVGKETDRTVLLDYLAILKDKRIKGYGSIFLGLLAECLNKVKGIILESEDDRFAIDEEDKKIRQKRLSFYLKNGLIDTKIRSKVFGVDYIIMYLPCGGTLENEVIKEELQRIYEVMFYPMYMDKFSISAC